MTGGLLLHFIGIYVPYFYASLYGQALGAAPYTAFQITAVLNAATFFGRFVMGAISDKIGHSNALVLCVTASAMLCFAWQAVSNLAGIFVWVVFYGWFSGASISLQSPAIIPLVPAPKTKLMGPYIAILCQLSSFGSLAGSPIAGALLRDRHSNLSQGLEDPTYRPEDFHSMMWFVGAVLFAAAIFYQVVRYRHTPNMLTKA
jgi:MFS family permease